MISVNDIDIKNIKQVIEPECQETFININYFDKTVKIFTTRATVMKRLLRKGYKPSKVETMQGEICSMTFEFDSKDIGNFLRQSIFKYD
ncbi:hypothetical protein [uncultured Clostridium sp.]|uniref:hypothetical protein n=1 Tax=uncultured Clostridium sp. TaxID=59620 RepID=UPI0025E9976A|nr:hypothetical protein [uncultured Clostridium sp.]